MSEQHNAAMEMPNFSLSGESGLAGRAPTSLSTDVKYIQEEAARLKEEAPALVQYSELQHVQLTKIQFELLGAITQDKLHEASLRDIVSAYKVLKDKELVSQGKPTDIQGLVGYLQILEDEEAGIIDVTPAPEPAERVPNL